MKNLAIDRIHPNNSTNGSFQKKKASWAHRAPM
jgi:hypothetical protein